MPQLFVQRGKPILIKKTNKHESKSHTQLIPKYRGGEMMIGCGMVSVQRKLTPSEYDQMLDTEKRFAAIDVNGGSVGGVVHHKKAFKPLKLKF